MYLINIKERQKDLIHFEDDMKKLTEIKLGIKIDDKKIMDAYYEILNILKDLKTYKTAIKCVKNKYKD